MTKSEYRHRANMAKMKYLLGAMEYKLKAMKYKREMLNKEHKK